jgi:aryl-alcohol dehydrogenase-like predicted oxidoreductase
VELRALGDSELVVSAVGLGCNSFGSRIGREQAHAVVRTAFAAGVTLFDTADGYGAGLSEMFLGEALGVDRQSVVVATKFGSNRAGEKYGVARGSALHVRRATEDSLARLGTDYIDVLYYHMHDGTTPLAETLGSMAELVAEGKVRAIGCANFDAVLLAEADDLVKNAGIAHVAVTQNQYSLLAPAAQTSLLPVCRERNIGFIPYWPLAYGLLSGKYVPGEAPPADTRLGSDDSTIPPIPPQHWDLVEDLQAFAEARGRRLLELAIGGLLSRPGVTSVIAGATKPDQVAANVSASHWRLSDDELSELDVLVHAA